MTKVVARLEALGISGADIAAADAATVPGRTLLLLAQELVKKVPVKVCNPAQFACSLVCLLLLGTGGQQMHQRKAC